MREGIGHSGFEEAEKAKAKMICNNPYPCDFDRGSVEAVAKRFKPAGSSAARVTHDDSAPYRKKGGDACTYLVEWQRQRSFSAANSFRGRHPLHKLEGMFLSEVV
jgi:hypothetical protein